MSLTSHLKSPYSPVRKFLEKSFPILRLSKRGEPYAKEFSAILGFDALPPCSLPTLAPKSLQGTIGTAVDYRLRYYFRAYDSHETVAGKGVSRFSGKAGTIGREFLDYQNKLAARLSPVGRHLSSKDEAALNTGCVILAWFDSVIRTGVVFPDLALRLRRAKKVGDLLSAVQQDMAQDLSQLSSAFASDAQKLFGVKAILNPTFRGSIDIPGGADADIIVGNALMDFKCTSKVDAQKLRNAALQLLGYVLLDYDDEYAITELMTYLPRQRLAWRMPLWKLVLPPGVVYALVKNGDAPEMDLVAERLRNRRQKFRKVVLTARESRKHQLLASFIGK